MMSDFYLSTGKDKILQYVTPALRNYNFGGLNIQAKLSSTPSVVDHTSLYMKTDAMQRATARRKKL